MTLNKRTFLLAFVHGGLGLALAIWWAPAAQAQTYTVMHNFTGGSDGASPIAGLTIDANRNLYGTTSAGGGLGFGNVYRLLNSGSHWTFDLLYTFQGFTDYTQDGSAPYSRVVFGQDGSLYGTTHSGGDGQGCLQLHGCGTIFSLKPSGAGSWQETVLYQFGNYNGSNPDYGSIVFDQAGNLYGTTRNGGANLKGTVYGLVSTYAGWTEKVIHSFAGSPDGSTPLSGPVIDQAGKLYGTTSAGGAYGWGTVYQLKPAAAGWTEVTLYNFQNGSDGSVPTAGVVVDSAANLYGATQAGGTAGGGTVFRLTRQQDGSWALSTIYEFPGPTLGGSNRNLIMDYAGNLYGTTSGGSRNPWGSVFRLAPSGDSGWKYTSLHNFTGGLDGGTPYGSLIRDTSGKLYGTASMGGAYGFGVAFEITP